MVIGAGCFAFLYEQQVVCWIYLADFFFVLSGLLMVDNAYMCLRDAFTDCITYLQLIYNKWVLLLLVAAILEIYTMHRISHLLKKEEDRLPDSEKNLN